MAVTVGVDAWVGLVGKVGSVRTGGGAAGAETSSAAGGRRRVAAEATSDGVRAVCRGCGMMVRSYSSSHLRISFNPLTARASSRRRVGVDATLDRGAAYGGVVVLEVI